MSWLILKTHNLIFKAWTITGTNTLNFAGIKRRTVDIFKNNLLCFVICPTDMAYNLVFTEILSFIRERLGRFITFLNFKLRKIN